MKYLPKIIFAILALVISAFCYLYFLGTSDLRTEELLKDAETDKAKSLIEEMAKAHLVENWGSISTYTVQFKEEMFGLVGKFGNPFPETKSQFELSYIPNSYDGQLSFTKGENKGIIWGIQSWETYTKKENESPIFKDNANITFWIPTYQYFIEFPKRILNANVLGYAGQKIIEGINCEGVLASWNTLEPQRDIDQYLIWLDSDSKRIIKLEYTVRDQYNFLTGAAYYKDYKNFNGILLPTRMPVESNLLSEGEILHQMDILDFQKNVLKTSDLRPDSKLKIIGDEK